MSEVTMEASGVNAPSATTDEPQSKLGNPLEKSMQQHAQGSEVDAVDDLSSQYVTFAIANEAFGFNMQSVKEIIRIPNTVEVPLTPPALVGLANLRGVVLPILDLRAILGLEQQPNNDASRVIITDIGTPVGLIVDKVLQVTSADEALVDRSQHVTNSVDAALLDGVIKQHDGKKLTQLLNVKNIISADFHAVIARASNIEQQTVNALSNVEGALEEDNQLVSFLVDQQEFAFDLMDVEEIVRMPDNVVNVPNTPTYMLGIMELRKRLLPLIDLRSLFGLVNQATNENTRILVVNTAYGQQSVQVGLVVDQVREVLRVNNDARDEVPPLLRSGDDNDIHYVCRLDNGKRLVSVLCTDALFKQHALRQVMDAAGEQKDDEMNQAIQEVSMDEDIAQLVVFHLNQQEFAVSIEDVQEITRIPDQLDRVPKTPEFIEGMVNLRGTVMPVIDMRTRFGLSKMERSDRQRIIVMQLNGHRTGFVVDSVAQVIRLPISQIEQSPNLSDEQARMMGQVVNLKEQKRMIQVLEAKALLNECDLSQLLEDVS
jgi:purine-binding chemotaxis protein CheW